MASQKLMIDGYNEDKGCFESVINQALIPKELSLTKGGNKLICSVTAITA